MHLEHAFCHNRKPQNSFPEGISACSPAEMLTILEVWTAYPVQSQGRKESFGNKNKLNNHLLINSQTERI